MLKQLSLANGLKLITSPMRGTKTATILVMVGTGSKYENRKNSGVSHFLEHLFFKGTIKRPTTLAISSELDGIGAEFNAFTGKEYTGYWVKADALKIELAFDIVSDMLFHSKFDAGEIERERGVIIEEFNMYLDNPMMHIEDVFEKCLYGDTPAGRDTIGTKKTILNLSRPDFVSYLNSQYSAVNTVVCAAGKIDKKSKILALAKKYFTADEFKQRGKNFAEKVAVVENQLRPAVKLHYKKSDQAHLSLGVRTFGYNHKDKLIAKMIAVILGGSMSSRLFINLRERQGLAYYVRTEAESYTDSGYLTARAGVPVAKIEKAIKIILNEYKKLTKILVAAEELKRSKDLIFGRSAIQFEASDNLANWYGRQAIMSGAIRRCNEKEKIMIASPEAYLKKIRSISALDIRRVAKDIFVNQGLNLAVIGPYRDEKKFEKFLKL